MNRHLLSITYCIIVKREGMDSFSLTLPQSLMEQVSKVQELCRITDYLLKKLSPHLG